MTNVDAGVFVVGVTSGMGRRGGERLPTAGVPVRDGPWRAGPPLDRADGGGWERAFRGLGAAYLAFFPDLIVPGAAETPAHPDGYDRVGGLL